MYSRVQKPQEERVKPRPHLFPFWNAAAPDLIEEGALFRREGRIPAAQLLLTGRAERAHRGYALRRHCAAAYANAGLGHTAKMPQRQYARQREKAFYIPGIGANGSVNVFEQTKRAREEVRIPAVVPANILQEGEKFKHGLRPLKALLDRREGIDEFRLDKRGEPVGAGAAKRHQRETRGFEGGGKAGARFAHSMRYIIPDGSVFREERDQPVRLALRTRTERKRAEAFISFEAHVRGFPRV